MFQQFYGVFFQRLGLFLCQVEPHRDVIHLNDGHRGNSLQIQNKVALQFAESRQAYTITPTAQTMQANQVLGPGTVPYMTRHRIQLI